MRTRIFVSALLSLCVVSQGVAPAQQSPEKIESIRQQIQQLERQIQNLHNSENEATDGRSNRIGSSRPAGVRQKALVVQLYDLSDLFAVVPAYPAIGAPTLAEDPKPLFPATRTQTGAIPSGGMIGGGMGGMGGGGGMFDVLDPATPVAPQHPQILRQSGPPGGEVAGAKISLSNLVRAITETITPGSWTEDGGDSSIAILGNALLISAPEEAHDQIQSLLNLFRQRWGTLRTISIRAKWVWLDDARLGQLLANEERPDATAPSGARAYGVVNANAWQRLVGEMNNPASKLSRGHSATMTCYNGQTVSTVSGTERLMVTDLQPMLQTKGDDDDSPAPPVYQPDVRPVLEGVALQVTPSANQSGKIVVVDLRTRVTRLLDDGRPGQEADKRRNGRAVLPIDVTSAIDRPEVASQQFSTTLRIPVDVPVLVGSMSFTSDPEAAPAILSLFITASVQELRDDRPADKAATPQGEELPKKSDAGENSKGGS